MHKYLAQLLVSLPSDIPNLPFYNLHKNIDGDSIGSIFSSDIANSLFEDFDTMWSISDLQKLINKFDFKKFRSCVSIKIYDREKDMIETQYGVNGVGDAAVNFLIFLIKRKIGLN